jgi:ribonuclease E
MITSFSRLFRQIFGGSQAQPATEALSRDIAAESEAREAAEHRESLKRAMEAAFATPTATADEPPPQTVVELQALAEEAATASAVHEELAEEAPLPEVPEAVAEPAIAEPLEIVADMPVEELAPAIELAEVEEPTEHDIEIVEWDIAKLAEPEAPAVEVQVAEVAFQADIEEEIPATAEIESVEAPEDEDVEHEDVVAQQPATAEEIAEDAAPALTAEFVAAATKSKRAKKAKAPAKKKSSTTKKKTAAKKTVALPEDAVWLSDAIAFSLKGEWSTVWTPPEDASGAERLEAFREKAASGDLVVWGCPEGAQAWEPVRAALLPYGPRKRGD